MRKVKKSVRTVLLLLLVCLLAMCLCACSGGADGTNGINGQDGINGTNGKSAYEIWLDEGHTGSQADFLEWLKGKSGSDGTGADGVDGKDGKSAYEIWLDEGHTGSQADFLEWLKGKNGQDGTGTDGVDGKDGADGKDGKSAFEIFMQQYPYYNGTEEQWIRALVNGELKIHTVTFKSEVSEDIVKYVVGGYTLPEIPEVPEKEGQTSAAWNVTDFSNITQDMEVTAVYDMRKYITFHNEFTEDDDIVKVVNYGEALVDIPNITVIPYNDGKWSIADFSCILGDMNVEAVYETQGLQFTPINQQTQYKVSVEEISIEANELFIPTEHSGKPVTIIEVPYNDNRKQLTFVYIPNGITEIRGSGFYSYNITKININTNAIDDNTFYSCPITEIIIGPQVTMIPNNIQRKSLENIKVSEQNSNFSSQGNCLIDKTTKTLLRATNTSFIPSDGSVEIIGYGAFWGCQSLASIEMPNSVTTIEDSAFTDCSNLTNITIPNSVTSIGGSAFSLCTSLTSIKIPNSVTSIGGSAFAHCVALTSIVLPNSIVRIGAATFAECSKLETIYYTGTQDEFNQIDIMDTNEPFTEATVYCFSVNRPSDDGFYWHYGSDGKTPEIWTKEY